MTNEFEMAVMIAAIIGIVFIVLFAVAGFGSFEASAGHFLKDTFQGSSLEDPAASIEAAGNDLTVKAHGVITLIIGVLFISGLVYVRSKN